MVDCPVCKKHVDYKYLRSDNPRDETGHDLGQWVHCENNLEKHVYLRNLENTCPYCESKNYSKMEKKQLVKCLHETEGGLVCTTRPYSWMEEGPPCFMNHVAKTRLEKT